MMLRLYFEKKTKGLYIYSFRYRDKKGIIEGKVRAKEGDRVLFRAISTILTFAERRS